MLGETDPLSIPGVDMAALLASNLESFDSAPSGRTALVPGFFAGVEAAQRRFGKRRFSDVVAPAIRCAEQGFVLLHRGPRRRHEDAGGGSANAFRKRARFLRRGMGSCTPQAKHFVSPH